MTQYNTEATYTATEIMLTMNTALDTLHLRAILAWRAVLDVIDDSLDRYYDSNKNLLPEYEVSERAVTRSQEVQRLYEQATTHPEFITNPTLAGRVMAFLEAKEAHEAVSKALESLIRSIDSMKENIAHGKA